MKEKVIKYWSDVHGSMVVAIVLDPRYKVQLLNALFLKINGTESAAKEPVEKVSDLLYSLVLQYQDTMEGIASTDGSDTRASVVAQTKDDDD
jgi:hypothetical protein